MAHVHEKIDFVADALIVYKDKVLLRKHEKYKMLLTVGGHIEPDEDPIEALVREVKEEVGLDIEIPGQSSLFEAGNNKQELVPPRFLNRHRINDNHEHVALTYIVRSTTDAVVESDDEKSDGIHWFNKEELIDPALDIDPLIRHYALTALAELGEA